MTTENVENSAPGTGDPDVATETAAAPAALVKSITAFASEHGGSAKAVLQPIGRAGVRITLVGDDGILGDRVAPDLATAEAVVERVDSVTVADEWDRELTSVVTPRAGHFKQMAGWVAHQTRFPKARNGL